MIYKTLHRILKKPTNTTNDWGRGWTLVPRKGWVMVRVMVFNATFNNISAISWRSVLLVGETGVPGEKN